MTGVLLEVEAKPGKERTTRLVMTDEAVIFTNVEPFRWSEIDRVMYQATDNHINGSYMGTTFRIGVGSGKRTGTFLLNSGTTGALKHKIDHERRTANQTQWVRAIEILEERVCVRLATEAVTAVLRGESVELGGVRLDRQGVHKGGLFKKSVPWSEVAGSRVRYPYFEVLIHKGTKTKAGIQINAGQWNMVLLSRVITVLSR
jgi:hypothetical protein